MSEPDDPFSKAPALGFEPRTVRLTAGNSTVELYRKEGNRNRIVYTPPPTVPKYLVWAATPGYRIENPVS